MIYLTQFIYIKEGKEEIFEQFENFAIPLMEQYNGEMLFRIRPQAGSFITGSENKPYEIHFLSFNSEQDLENFLSDDSRLRFIHLKEESVQTTFLVKGEKM